jgi:hypothetical protein
VGAAIDQPALVEYEDLVRAPDGREPVRDHKRGAAFEENRQSVLDDGLCLRVEVGGRLVQDQDDRVLYESPGYCQSLLLASREPVSTLPDDRLVAVGQPPSVHGL